MKNCANALNQLLSLATTGHTISVLSVQSLMSLIQCWYFPQSLGINVSLQDVGAEDLGPDGMAKILQFSLPYCHDRFVLWSVQLMRTAHF